MTKKMVSLFDYLGRPAGSALGWAVAKKATLHKAAKETRIIETKNYKGPVNVYEESLLESFFKDAANKELIEKDRKWYEQKQAQKITIKIQP